MALFSTTPDKVKKWIEQGNAKKLIGALTSTDAIVRRMSVEGLARIGGDDVLEYCRKNITNQNDTIRWDVTKILGLMGTPEAIKLMGSMGDPTEIIRDKVKKEKGE